MMLCVECNKEIQFDGVIVAGRPYHIQCHNKIENREKKEALLQLSQISGIDEYLMQYFNNNPLDANKAIENKYFALIGVREKNSCNSGVVYWTEEGQTQEEFDIGIKLTVKAGD